MTRALADPACDAVLAEAAFGANPQLWPLPEAQSARGLWWRAVAAGGQGRYATAVSDLDALRRRTTGPLTSLACSTRGSFVRQLGWHDAARAHDGRAWASAGGDAEAAVDALVGLAADALGTGRFPAAQALLNRAVELLAAPDGDTPARCGLRAAWVSAELAMVSGQGREAVRHASHAQELASAVDVGARHRVKTAMVAAAARCSVGEFDNARAIGDDALAQTRLLGLVPLRWALAGLLADIGSEVHTREALLAERDTCADTVRKAGGAWRNH